ncbi:unnamed protein product [Malus baccata var. baccata]
MGKRGMGNQGSSAHHSKGKKERIKSENLVCFLCFKSFGTKKAFQDHLNNRRTAANA